MALEDSDDLAILETMEDDTMDSPVTNMLEIVKMLAEEEDMKVTAFGTRKGLSILVVTVLVGVALVQPLAWGLASGLIVGSILVTFICWEEKSVVEVLANMPRQKQMELIQKILSTGIELSKLTPTSWLLGAPTPQSEDGEQRDEPKTEPADSRRRSKSKTELSAADKDKSKTEPYDGRTVILPNGKVATREEVLLALRDCLAKDMGMSVTK